MKNFDLTSMGVREMDLREMQETDGGVIWFLVAAVVILLTAESCQSQVNLQIGGYNNSINDPTQAVDSTLNGNDVKVPSFVK
jgi:hypothetical protein